jgi:hypothetical protein
MRGPPARDQKFAPIQCFFESCVPILKVHHLSGSVSTG